MINSDILDNKINVQIDPKDDLTYHLEAYNKNCKLMNQT